MTVGLAYSFTLGVAAMEGRGFYYPVDVGVGSGRLYILGRSHEGDTRGIQVCMMDWRADSTGPSVPRARETGSSSGRRPWSSIPRASCTSATST